jgi:predicted PurR-regulated permease PerM
MRAINRLRERFIMHRILPSNPRSPVVRAPADLTWAGRRDRIVVALSVTAFVFIGLWLASHVLRAIILLILGALLAYTLWPAVRFLRRYMPRPLALLLVYLVLVAVIGGVGYLVVTAAISEFTTLAPKVQTLLSSGPHGQPSPLVQALERLGFTAQQISATEQQLVAQLQGAAQSIVPFVAGLINSTVDVLLVLVLSVYLLIDGERLAHWLATSPPLATRGRVISFLTTLQRVVGGYIRGQLIMSTLIGLLVGVGMFVLRVPDAALLGVMAFILEFIPILGTLVSGAVCVLIALTQGWVLALIVLAYFVVVHVIEGDIVGPRIVGKAVGVHPAVSLVALIAGADLYGVLGALLASPVAGLIQAILLDVYAEWRKAHPDEFSQEANLLAVATEAAAVTATYPADQRPLEAGPDNQGAAAAELHADPPPA